MRVGKVEYNISIATARFGSRVPVPCGVSGKYWYENQNRSGFRFYEQKSDSRANYCV